MLNALWVIAVVPARPFPPYIINRFQDKCKANRTDLKIRAIPASIRLFAF